MDSKLLVRFFSKVKQTDNCWIWTGATSSKGYGTITVNNKTHSTHRLSYELFKRLIPTGLTIDHLCRNKLCVNPDHLEAVTNKVNILRGIGLTAINSRKTHCPRGHQFTGKRDNLGSRICLICNRTKSKRDRQKRKELQSSEVKCLC